ncbi:hypothetical protein RP726_05410 [Candidatus Methylospira mobilis]|uniref:hypothetical protein n=1 Tax=Candidatus Methylospira mobilis TaxID=1808979 RepID=UPI0028E4F456|nr:hypothetical protein [Candidatus Methylospira mobilis]WNV05849.1 hypothetical protein RP726_05410 [Candidatus Methylospira mobilis]
MAGAAEGKVVANLFAPAGDWDVPAGFAKNGDTLPHGADAFAAGLPLLSGRVVLQPSL